MAKKRFGIAIIGAGMIGFKHAQVLSSMQRPQLVAIYDHRIENAQRLAEQFDCDAYSDLEQLLKREDIQIVSICSPSGLHGQQAILCANAGKHILVEKPMDIRWEQAQQMIAACHHNQVKLGVISQHRFHPDIIKAKTMINQGQLGKIIAGNASINWYRNQEYYDSASWRGTKRWDGGGALMNQGIHTIDLLQYLAGPVNSVYAQCRTAGHDRIEVEDVAAITLQYNNGAIGTLFATTCAYPGYHTRIELIGTKGTIILENNKLQCIHLSDDPASSYISPTSPSSNQGQLGPEDTMGETHIDQLEDFLDAIELDREPAVNGEEGAKPLGIVIASYLSSDAGRPVQIREIWNNG
ncbi:Gfo/Idh/MocA family protein [Paenibacillus glycanilyticus]|uniref:Oxidoreductase n=1 Tax=Paenibacillus glycanilyticus TaxID=126569 RepID=A0ABQ6G7N5_9BACL|nr:Gfo/Idh/MocA family oxidoreductase [Paenibacillus glycanilyticus]GLX66969.1 oxidoreductase [Paenibacillus glycanilyticus]